MSEIVFDYQFKFDDGSERNFTVKMDSETGMLLEDKAHTAPEWTKLDFHKCSHCPYNSKDMPICPVAHSVARVAETFSKDLSYKSTRVFVKTDNRFYGKDTDLQSGLQSLFGLVMGASACAHMSIFKPMARYHLPFSSFDETVVRVLGKYLISQFLKAQKGEKPDLKLEQLMERYSQINTVNQFVIRRIRAISKGDADKNAIVILDGFASLLPMEMQTGFESLSKIFNS